MDILASYAPFYPHFSLHLFLPSCHIVFLLYHFIRMHRAHSPRTQHTKNHAKRAAPRRQQRRRVATTPAVRQRSPIAAAPVVTSSQRSISTNGPILSKSHPLYETMNKATSAKMNALGPMTTSSARGVAIRSFQIAWLKNWLCKRGLFFEDIYEGNVRCSLAVDSLPRDVRVERMRRIIRSIDMEVKLVDLPDDMQDYDPFVSYGLDDAVMTVSLFTNTEANYV